MKFFNAIYNILFGNKNSSAKNKKRLSILTSSNLIKEISLI